MDYFEGIMGQEHALAVLRRALETEKINHAYLFMGPAGVGKKTTARAFARAIILAADPAGEVYLRENAHPDLMSIEKMENKTMIGIEQINRDMEPWLALKPYRAGRRVVIINEAHLMSLSAANALLKTLEEPPGHAVIILVTNQQYLMATIVSRCQLIRFSPASESALYEILLKRGVEAENASRLARWGQGSFAAAVALAEEEGLAEMLHTACTIMKQLSEGNDIEIFRCAEQMEAKPAVMAGLLTTLLRDIYVFQATGKNELLIAENNRQMYEQFKPLDQGRVNTVLLKIDELRRQYNGPVSSLLLSINISYQLQDALK